MTDDEIRRQTQRDVDAKRERDLGRARQERWGWHVGRDPETIPQSEDRRAWSNKRDTENAEEEFVPPDQLPPRTAPPGYSGGSSIGGTMTDASFADAVDAGHAVKAALEQNLGASLFHSKETAQDMLSLLLALSGDLGAASLANTKAIVAGIDEKLAECLQQLQVAIETLDTYIAMVQRS